jgi:predicted anti-sigma-YlaC factor YlaD
MSTGGDVVCQDVVELLTDYLEGALSADLRRRIDEHLGACDGCTNALEQLRETILLTGRLTEDQVPPAEREAVREAFIEWRRDALLEPPQA